MGDVRDYREEFSRPFHITLPSDRCAFEHEFKQFFNLRMAIETLREILMALFTAELVRAVRARKRSDKIYHKFRYNELWRLSAQKFSTNIKIPWLITFGFIFIVIDDLTFFRLFLRECETTQRLHQQSNVALRLFVISWDEKWWKSICDGDRHIVSGLRSLWACIEGKLYWKLKLLSLSNPNRANFA